MKLNLKFYKGKDEYSDGDIEDKIIEFIKKYPDNYEKAFEEDSSWPVFYHLADRRKNVIRWYPFKKNASILEVGGGMGAITSELCQKCKKVTSIELSKKRATAILERNKNAKNLEIIVGNFKDIVLKEKYDYILLNGVLEYSALYIDSENPYEDFINQLKKNLRDNGKILIAIENRFGLKYWCGACEDHTNRIFDGINNYKNNSKIKTFSKNDLEYLFNKLNLNYNFYYLLPDYKFPEIVLTDEFVQNEKNICYTPYYWRTFKMFGDEKKIFKDILMNNVLDFFANSYFIELSLIKTDKEVLFAKYNDSRNKKYAIETFEKNGKFYKKAKFEQGKEHIENILEYDKLLNKYGINTLEIYKDEIGIYTNYTDFQSLSDYLIDLCKKGNLVLLKETINNYVLYLKKHFCKEKINEDVNTIFEKYNIEVSNEIKDNLYFIKDGFIDLIFQNILVNKSGNYIAFDQEWLEKFVPLEYIVYRAIRMFIFYNLSNMEYNVYIEKIYNYILDNLCIKMRDYIELFDKLEEKIINKIVKNDIGSQIFNKYTRYENSEEEINIIWGQYEDLEKNNSKQNEYIKVLESELGDLKRNIIDLRLNLDKSKADLNNIVNNYNEILNSKTWKLKTKIDNILHRKK